MARALLRKLEQLKDMIEGSPQEKILSERARMFRAYARAAVEDGVLSDAEVAYLHKAAVDLGLPDTTGQKVLRDEVVALLRTRLASASYTKPADAVALLNRVQADLKCLRFNWKDVCRNMRQEILAYLGRVLDSLWHDNIVDESELKAFRTIVQKFGLNYAEVCRTFAPRTQSELEAVLNINFCAGEVRSDVLEYVTDAAVAFGLSPAAVARLSSLGQRLASFAQIRKGILPNYESPILLEVGERCVFAAQGCRLLRRNSRRGDPPDVGTLIVTTRSLYFVPRDGGVRTVRLRSILSVVPGAGCLELTSPKKGLSGTIWLAEDDLAAEVLYAAIAMEKRNLLPPDAEGRSRVIPQPVKHAVWHRDGGRCIQCGSIQNIHYDHVIPFSKGGSSSIENIQLLCAACNLGKGNRI